MNLEVSTVVMIAAQKEPILVVKSQESMAKSHRLALHTHLMVNCSPLMSTQAFMKSLKMWTLTITLTRTFSSALIPILSASKAMPFQLTAKEKKDFFRMMEQTLLMSLHLALNSRQLDSNLPFTKTITIN